MNRRMIHESLFYSTQLSELCFAARYLYIGTIVHADDSGRMRADIKYLKLKCFPFDDVNLDEIRAWRNQLSTNGGFLVVYLHEGKEYLYHPKWEKWQTLRKDRVKPTDCPSPATICQPDVNQVTTSSQPDVGHLVAEVKEVNRTELNPSEVREGKEVIKIARSRFATPDAPATRSPVEQVIGVLGGTVREPDREANDQDRAEIHEMVQKFKSTLKNSGSSHSEGFEERVRAKVKAQLAVKKRTTDDPDGILDDELVLEATEAPSSKPRDQDLDF